MDYIYEIVDKIQNLFSYTKSDAEKILFDEINKNHKVDKCYFFEQVDNGVVIKNKLSKNNFNNNKKILLIIARNE